MAINKETIRRITIQAQASSLSDAEVSLAALVRSRMIVDAALDRGAAYQAQHAAAVAMIHQKYDR